MIPLTFYFYVPLAICMINNYFSTKPPSSDVSGKLDTEIDDLTSILDPWPQHMKALVFLIITSAYFLI